jgi:hypothetical protein
MNEEYNKLRDRIGSVWDKGKVGRDMNWLGLEQLLVDILNSSIHESDQIYLLKEAIDAHTRRGHFTSYLPRG